MLYDRKLASISLQQTAGTGNETLGLLHKQCKGDIKTILPRETQQRQLFLEVRHNDMQVYFEITLVAILIMRGKEVTLLYGDKFQVWRRQGWIDQN